MLLPRSVCLCFYAYTYVFSYCYICVLIQLSSVCLCLYAYTYVFSYCYICVLIQLSSVCLCLYAYTYVFSYCYICVLIQLSRHMRCSRTHLPKSVCLCVCASMHAYMRSQATPYVSACYCVLRCTASKRTNRAHTSAYVSIRQHTRFS
jgi:hypothetical protein